MTTNMKNEQEGERCKQIIYRYRGLIFHKCLRYSTKDGYCKQHHPDEVKKRELHRQKKHDATPFNMIHRY